MRLSIAVWLVAGVLAASGCGSDGESAGTSTSAEDTAAATATSAPVSKPEFVEAADAICDRLDSETQDVVGRIGKLQKSYPDAPNEKALDKRVREVADLNRRFVEIFQAGNQELEDLDAPDDPVLSRYIEERDRYADAVTRTADAQDGFAAAPERGQAKANKAIVAGFKAQERSFATLKRLAKDFGFETCHRGK